MDKKSDYLIILKLKRFRILKLCLILERIKCAICDFITSVSFIINNFQIKAVTTCILKKNVSSTDVQRWARVAAVLLLLLGVGSVSMGTVCWKCSWRHLSFAGREITFEDFVSKYLASGEVRDILYS